MNIRHVISRLMIFSILFANLAWAVDMADVSIATEPGTLLLVGDQTDWNGSESNMQQDLQKGAACDDYCQGSAHNTGLTSGSLPFLPKADCADQPLWLTALQSRDQTPPQHPPRI